MPLTLNLLGRTKLFCFMKEYPLFQRSLLLIAVVALLSAAQTVDAQYKVNKHKYDRKSYTYQPGDPYNPAVCGVVSFLIPGVGQMIASETGRGVAFLAGYVGCWVVYGVGIGTAATSTSTYQLGSGAGLALAGLFGAIAVDIWATVDAVRVAKVNNLAWRDEYTPGTGLQISPDLKLLPGQKVAPGLTLTYNF